MSDALRPSPSTRKAHLLCWAAAGAIALSTAQLAAEPPKLVADLVVAGEQALGSAPAELTQIGSRVIFTATPGYQRELFATDGTRQGTVPLLPPCASPLAELKILARPAADWALVAWKCTRPYLELWRTGGTPATTFRLIGAEAKIYETPAVLLASGRAYFLHGFEVEAGGGIRDSLWSTHGTPEGTSRFDLNPLVGAGVFAAAIVDSRIALLREKDDLRTELWVTDGSIQAAELIPCAGSEVRAGATVDDLVG
jgi:hypothetical protein